MYTLLNNKEYYVLLVRFYIVLLLVFISNNIAAQSPVTFAAHPNQKFGFDRYEHSEWSDEYHVESVGDSIDYYTPTKSVMQWSSDTVLFISKVYPERLRFFVEDSSWNVRYRTVARDTYALVLPPMKREYWLDVLYKKTLLGKLHVNVLPKKEVKVQVVTLGHTTVDSIYLSNYLKQVFYQAGIKPNVAFDTVYKSQTGNSLLQNPNEARKMFTQEMRLMRDDYFSNHPLHPTDVYYVFLIDGFVNPSIEGYSVRNKALSFVNINSDNFERAMARELAVVFGGLYDTWRDLGPRKGGTDNLLDIEGDRLRFVQWSTLRERIGIVAYFDDYESVRTNNGIIASYMWEEDENGNVHIKVSPKKAIIRPNKRNAFSVILDIDSVLYKPWFQVFSYRIGLIHIIVLLVTTTVCVALVRRSLRSVPPLRRFFILRWALKGLFVVFFLWASYYLLGFINKDYDMFEVRGGTLASFEGKRFSKVKRELKYYQVGTRLQEKEMGSEIFIKRGDQWVLKRRKRVLYFDVVADSSGVQEMTFVNNSDSLKLKSINYNRKALSHYMVFRYYDANGQLQKESVSNHLGFDITNKIKLADPPRRVLLFVNGYRPTSLGKTFEENFADIRKNGLEFPDSKNKIYTTDRFSYWKWNHFSDAFSKRLNPDDVYYADGHHSVHTSNHRSLIEFTKLTQLYPKRCVDPSHHTCQMSSEGWNWLGISKEINTVEYFNLRPNYSGFSQRVNAGKIAGRNLHQTLNELPNKSKNDTLYLVCHSMGYAYALGIIEQMRDRIQFGGLYIFAAENATAGNVSVEEWGEIWQYGSNFEANALKAPCLLDGIAPQRKAGGLSKDHRVFIPSDFYRKMGFYASHYIGNYSWVFDIPKNQSGYIEQK